MSTIDKIGILCFYQFQTAAGLDQSNAMTALWQTAGGLPRDCMFTTALMLHARLGHVTDLDGAWDDMR